MIQLAKIVNPEVRRLRKITDELDEQDKQAYAKIAEARFAVDGTSSYPDATFTLRLAFGPVVWVRTGWQADSRMDQDGGKLDMKSSMRARQITTCPCRGRKLNQS